jgi:hypothetical protein
MYLNGIYGNKINKQTQEHIKKFPLLKAHVYTVEGRGDLAFKSLCHKKQSWHLTQEHDSISFACKKTTMKLFLAGQYPKKQYLGLCY